MCPRNDRDLAGVLNCVDKLEATQRRSTRLDITHPRQIHLLLRVNRPSIVWLAARRQGRFALLPFDFHLDDARFAGYVENHIIGGMLSAQKCEVRRGRG